MKLRLCEHADCAHDEPDCTIIGRGLYGTLGGGRYDYPASLLHLWDWQDYTTSHRTTRKRSARALRLGYTIEPISRADHVDAIWAINTSLKERQGRPMDPAYLSRPEPSRLPAYACARHRINEHGCFTSDGELVAYLVSYVSGDIGLISQILGHGAHLANDVMYLLATETFADVLETSGPVIWFYNRHDSGTDGLRYFKERLGFRPERVEWAV